MRKLYRSTKDKKIAGLCGGLAEIYNWDPSVVRLIFVFAFCITGFFPLGFMYVVAWLIVPVANEEIPKL